MIIIIKLQIQTKKKGPQIQIELRSQLNKNICYKKFTIQSNIQMQKSKKQKHQQEIRKSLKTLSSLSSSLTSFFSEGAASPQLSLLQRSYPYIHGVTLLRMCTLFEINYLISSVIDIIKKTNNLVQSEDLKIGIIGGGIMGRMILNTLIIYTKEGLKTQNIMISTRQPHHLQFYVENFHIQTFFDNQRIANESDIIFVATPGTLDNWILTDLNKNLQPKLIKFFNQTEYTHNSYHSTMSLMMSDKSKASSIDVLGYNLKNTSKPAQFVVNHGSTIKLSSHTSPSQHQPSVLIDMKSQKSYFYPLVYILTSDFHQQKCQRIFKFPVLTPFVAAKDISVLIQKIKQKISTEQNNNNQRKMNLESDQLSKLIQQVIAQTIFRNNSKEQYKLSDQPNQQQQQQKKQIKQERIERIIHTFQFFGKKIQDQWRRQLIIRNSQKKLSHNAKIQSIRQVFKAQENYQNTFFTKCRKWKMAYNNFIA